MEIEGSKKKNKKQYDGREKNSGFSILKEQGDKHGQQNIINSKTSGV